MLGLAGAAACRPGEGGSVFRFDGKVAFITGAGSGIARASAGLFAAQGARVVIAELQPALGEATAAMVTDAGGDALFVHTDVTDDGSVADAVAQTVDRYGRIDVLYNCAGGSIAADGPVTDVDLAVWDHTLALDLKGPMLTCRHALPHMIAGGGGAIVNMSSVVALRGAFPSHMYVAAKGGVISLTKALAGRHARDGIRVNVICPGMVLTDRVERYIAEHGQEAAADPRRVALDWQEYPFAVGHAEDIAHVALFLASDEARMLTGAVIAADGGLSAY
jgi:NAD(P)-dependent dehydrogenase (short-subunit alcohol dehydrogenase family)